MFEPTPSVHWISAIMGTSILTPKSSSPPPPSSEEEEEEEKEEKKEEEEVEEEEESRAKCGVKWTRAALTQRVPSASLLRSSARVRSEEWRVPRCRLTLGWRGVDSPGSASSASCEGRWVCVFFSFLFV